jgi:hypothetical protein
MVDEWGGLIRQFLENYQTLVNTSVTLRLPGSKGLRDSVARLANAINEPPKDDDTANTVKNEIEGLTRSVQSLGLRGSAGVFLSAAANGAGNPRDLYRSEVRDFIDKNDLWPLLKVKLG